jgi:Zn-dependent M28 family amino/carboxypeptidase
MCRAKYAIALALALVMALGVVGVASAAVPSDSSQLRKAVTADGILAHEQALQAIANANGGTRASGTPGFDASADYVAGKLKDAGYKVTRQKFPFAFFQETGPSTFERISPDPETYVRDTDYDVMEYSGSGDVTAEIVPTNDIIIPPTAEPSSTSGCEASDFPAETDGNIALIQRGTCDFVVKVQNAFEAGAVAVIIFNEGQEGRTDIISGTLGTPAQIPAVDTTFAVGSELYDLAQNGPVTVHITTQTVSEERQTENVIAETKTGRSDRVAFAGAHLDSVVEGPGINDNGSGSSTILEIALQMHELGIQPRNKVRFAFWGAEESGLVGSEYYVSQLSKREQKDIAAYLNFDMVASPNYVRFVYDGDGSDTALSGPNGSGRIESVFNDYFASQGLETDPTEFNGRSDYGPFIAVGIPAGGLFTGAEGVKTADQKKTYGGVAGAAYDPCYHQPCDSLTPVEDGADAALYAKLDAKYDLVGNINMEAQEEMSDGAAHALYTFTQTTSAVNGTSRGAANGITDLTFQGSHARK